MRFFFIVYVLFNLSYKLRIECMLLKEEFAANMSYLEPSINSMILAGEDLMTNKPLQEVLYMVLVAGNFLNSVSIFFQLVQTIAVGPSNLCNRSSERSYERNLQKKHYN